MAMRRAVVIATSAKRGAGKGQPFAASRRAVAFAARPATAPAVRCDGEEAA
jgi:hypothetical protein